VFDHDRGVIKRILCWIGVHDWILNQPTEAGKLDICTFCNKEKPSK